MAAGCYSDHLLVIKAYERWQEARREGTEAVFVRENFLHRGTLNMIEGGTKLDFLGAFTFRNHTMIQ